MADPLPRVYAVLLGLLALGTQQLFASPSGLKPGPVGIVYIAVGDNPTHHPFPALADAPGWNNPEVKGFLLRATWNVIEKQEGSFDFSYFDTALQLARQHRKFLGICVIAGVATPDWVYQAGTPKRMIARPRGRAISLPVPWDPVYLKKWRALVEALGNRYDRDPSVAYVDMSGPGRDIETFFVSDPGDVTAFEHSGENVLWSDAAITIAGYYAEAFPHTAILYAMGPPTPDDQGRQTIETVVHDLLKKYPGQFGIASNALSPHYDPPPLSARMIRENSATTTVGFQMYLPDKNGTTMHGSLRDALQNGINYGAHFIEVYAFDCNDPLQQSALHDANTGLGKIAAPTTPPQGNK